MRTFIVCLAIAAASGDAKPYTVAQVAAGLPVKNALAEGRAHNVGVITNAVEAGVKTVGVVPVSYAAGVYSGYPYAAVPHAAGVYSGYPYVHTYGKREAEPYTIGQVATGQTNGGVITSISYGHGTAPVPATAVNTVVPGVYSHVGVAPHHVAGVYSGYPFVHTYGKREAEPYTLEQVAHGKTAGGVVTAIDYGHGSGLVPATAVTHNTVAYHVPAAYSAVHAVAPAVYSTAYSGYPFTHYYG
eukprot:TRINITY_DN1219_c0_g1_i2.p2 TRINITY_DN1219_c0_g1~~TRINITY_DN1219_c0_g1_i2.p2  ORF type:complete len:243 (-),score=59.62 TRINITY_DN1219_c0_g1_i2:71-799(-)